ncbi:unnamed protein product [Musa acuminata var. zebrina]
MVHSEAEHRRPVVAAERRVYLWARHRLHSDSIRWCLLLSGHGASPRCFPHERVLPNLRKKRIRLRLRTDRHDHRHRSKPWPDQKTGEIEPRGCDALSGSEPDMWLHLEYLISRHRGTARLGGDGISGSVPDKRLPFLLSEIISGSLFYSTGGEKRPRFEARPSAATCSPKNGLRPAAAAAPRSQEECNEICFKDPVLKDHEWSYYIDRSPGHDNYSLECFRACISGCGFRFDIPKERVEEVRPKRPPKPTAVEPKPVLPHVEPNAAPDDLPSTSA